MAGAAHPLAQPPPPLVEWSDDVLNAIFCRVPFLSHGAVRAVCRRTRTLLSSPEFRTERIKSGYAESGVVVAGGERSCRHTTECWLLAGGRWWPRAPMSSPHFQACSAVIDNELWVCGGYDGDQQLATVEVYSPAANTWRSLPALNERRSGAVCGVVGGSLVVAGGFRDGSELTSAEAYSPAAARWNPIAPLPHAANLATACVLNGRLFVAGGDDTNRLQMWDTKKWTLKAPMPAVRCGAASVVHEGKMMVIGGYVTGEGTASSTSVILYDPQTDTWADGPPLPSPRYGCRAAEHAGAVILIGGGPPLRFKEGHWLELPNHVGSPTPHAITSAARSACVESVLLG